VDCWPAGGRGLIHRQPGRSVVLSGDQGRDVRSRSHRARRPPPRHESLGCASGNGRLASHLRGPNRGSPCRRVDACAEAIDGTSQNGGDRCGALVLPPDSVDRASACLRCRGMRATAPSARPVQYPLHELVPRSRERAPAEDHATPLIKSRSSLRPTRAPTRSNSGLVPHSEGFQSRASSTRATRVRSSVQQCYRKRADS